MPKPKNIINEASAAVDEFIQGLLLQFPNRMVKLQGHHVVMATDRRDNTVQLISGGGSGHEPSHAGWLGAGMLSAAVCGGIFASPSVHAVLAAIRACATDAGGGGGVLLVIKNYTGDRLNFGLAAERATQEGYQVEMIVVADDCALPRTKGITGARGVAGTVLVHKIAGAAAAAGKSLAEVKALAHQVVTRMGTLGVALDAVTMPGAESVNDRLDDSTIEIGLGIHGEQGIRQAKLMKADDMAREMITKICEYGRVSEKDGKTVVPMFEKGDEVVVLVNNLGGTSNFEMSILTRSCVKLLESNEFAVKCTRVLVGAYMTSFNMHGASLTVLNVEGHPELAQLLDTDTSAPAWMPCDVWQAGEKRASANEVPDKATSSKKVKVAMPPLAIDAFSDVAKTLIVRAMEQLADSEPLLTKYDTIVGDGDCGITMKRGATEVRSRIEQGSVSTDHPVSMLDSLADAVSASMGGTSGVLIELMLRKMSSTLARHDRIAQAQMCDAFQAGVEAVMLYGGAQVGSRTMLDALVPAAEVLSTSHDLAQAAEAAQQGADSTAQMESASAGRSNYLSADSLMNTPDPGAIAVAIVLKALAGT